MFLSLAKLKLIHIDAQFNSTGKPNEIEYYSYSRQKNNISYIQLDQYNGLNYSVQAT